MRAIEMMSLLIVGLLGCRENVSESNQLTEQVLPISSGPDQRPQFHASGDKRQMQKTTLSIGTYEVVIIYQDDSIKEVILPKDYNQPLKIRAFERMLSIYGLESLREICGAMDYKNQRVQVLTKIDSSIEINPFTKDAVRNAFRKKIGTLMSDEFPALFTPIDFQVKITAPFLNEQEIGKLLALFEREIHLDDEIVRFELYGDLNKLDNPSPLEPIMEFGRLICGILNSEAKVAITLIDNEGRRLTNNIENIEM
jgi:hypothetical protein